MENTKAALIFNTWIDEVGSEWLARKLKIHPQAIRNWKSLRSDPKVDHMRRIRRLSKGRITYIIMIDRRPITTKGTFEGPYVRRKGQA